MNWFADAIHHQIPGLANATNAVPVSIGWTGRNNNALSHDILATFDAGTFLLNVTINLVMATSRNSNLYALPLTVSI